MRINNVTDENIRICIHYLKTSKREERGEESVCGQQITRIIAVQYMLMKNNICSYCTMKEISYNLLSTVKHLFK